MTHDFIGTMLPIVRIQIRHRDDYSCGERVTYVLDSSPCLRWIRVYEPARSMQNKESTFIDIEPMGYQSCGGVYTEKRSPKRSEPAMSSFSQDEINPPETYAATVQEPTGGVGSVST